MSRCLGCGVADDWFCPRCDAELMRLYLHIKGLVRLMGEEQREGRIVLSASRVLEAFETIENTTALGKVEIDRRARELIMEVEDHFRLTPWCPACRKHRMEIIPGDPIVVSCVGGCTFS